MGKDKKKHKKKSSEHKKRHKKTFKQKSSSDDRSSSEEWVECDTAPLPATSQSFSQQRLGPDAISEQDEWVSNPALLACTSRDQLRQDREKKNNKNEQDKYMLDKLGQTERELNPYWRDGGSGLPQESAATVDSLRQSHVTVGDQGAAWLRKALQRAKEQAQDSGRPLAEVVAERWGSLDKLESMIAAAEERDKNKKNNTTDNSRFKNDEYTDRKHCYNQRGRHHQIGKEVHRERGSKRSFAKPRASSEDSSSNEKKHMYKKEFERKNEKLRHNRDDISDKRRKQKGERFKRVKESSDSSDDEVQNKYNKKSDKNKSSNTFSKPRSTSSSSSSSSSSSNTEEDIKYKNNYKQDKKSKISNRGFSKPANSSDEDERDYRERKGKVKYNSRELERNISSQDSKRKFARPHCDSEEDESGYKSKSRENKSRDYKSFSSSSGGWRKKLESQKKGEEVRKKNDVEKIEEKCTSKIEEDKTSVHEEESILTDKELNELGAKLVKAELLGNQELAEELKAKLSKAREAKVNAPKDPEVSKEVVILTHTDAKGFTRPVSLSGVLEPSGGRRKGRKVETHSDGKRMRYFADDDKYTLQDMLLSQHSALGELMLTIVNSENNLCATSFSQFLTNIAKKATQCVESADFLKMLEHWKFQREKLNTVEDSNEVFAKLASKGIGRDDSARDMEDVFEETARVEEGEGRQKERERQKAVMQSRRTARTLDNCQWCLDSQHMLKHLIVAIGTTCYLCVPPYQSLTENHCLIVPRTHTPCATQLDEDVWTEVQDFRKALVQMFLSLDEDVVFFESARRLNQFPHMILNCVPVPKETGDLAPIYFKKAIQECEQEWSNNKKLVDLRGRDVRRAVPKGLPYFAVDFGLDSGYAHVIEDEQLFPQNFAQEIIGGMMDLDHSIWRKQRLQRFEEQSKKVIQLSKIWCPFDITKKK